jgi:ribosomal protein L11 methyltransferase
MVSRCDDRGEASYSPFAIGGRLRIVPPGWFPAGDNRIDLIIARGAFGSGEHETTADCLDALARLYCVAGARVLDVGCGTGILAIAALKLGAVSAVGVDIEAKAVACARVNAGLNAVDERLDLITGGLEDVGNQPFDLVLANIYGDVLLRLGSEIVRRTTPGAHLVLSGILWQDNFDVVKLFSKLGCTTCSNHLLSEYSTIVLQRAG